MKQALYLSYDGMSDPLGQSQVLPYLEGLSKKGIRFTLISFEKPEKIEAVRQELTERCNAAHIHWIPMTYTKKPPVFSTVKDIRKLTRLAFKLHREKHFDLVHCRSYVTALAGLSLKRKKNVPFLFDMRGFWADERVEGKIWDLKNPAYQFIYNYFKKKEQQYLAESDAIVSLTHAGKQVITDWKIKQVSPEKITVIPCCVDTERFNPEAVNQELVEQIKHDYQLRDTYVVGYVGSIGTWYLLPEMLQAFKQIKQQHPNAVFVFLTQEKPEMLYEEITRQGLQREDFRAFPVAHKDMPGMLTLFDCSIFFIKPSFSKTASSPTKQGELMAMGIPLICNAGVGDTASIVAKYDAGIVVPDVSPETLENLNSDFRHFNREKSIEGAQTYFSLAYGVASYWNIYQQIWKKP